jgi:ABC-type transporter Mla MlaB component
MHEFNLWVNPPLGFSINPVLHEVEVFHLELCVMTSPSTTTYLKLSGRLTTPTSDDTHRAMQRALERREKLVLDCSEASEVDVSFLQLLVAVQRAAERSHKTVAFSTPPQGVLADALRRCGFTAPKAAVSLAEIF